MKLSRSIRRWADRSHRCEISHPRYATHKATLRETAKRLVPCARVYVSGGVEYAEFRLADIQDAFDLTTDELVFLLAQAVVEVAPGGTVFNDDLDEPEGLATIRHTCPADLNPGAYCACLG